MGCWFESSPGHHAPPLTARSPARDDGRVGRVSVFGATLAATALLACGGPRVKLAPLPPVTYERLGRVEGTGCGSLAIAWGIWAFIPIRLDSRLERAHRSALAEKPGATALVDVRVSEHWTWYLLALTRCTTVSGEAIR
jgi:hypothetical protein